MANPSTAFGLIPLRYRNGSPWNGKYNIYYVPSTDNTAIYTGDPVKSGSDATTDGVYPTVAQAAATDLILGVAIGFMTTPSTGFDINYLTRKYRPASTAMYVAVVDDPDVIFVAKEDSDANVIATSMIGNNFDIVVGSGSTTTGQSGVAIDSSDYKTATAQLRVLRLHNANGNVIGTNANWEVMINEHVFNGTVGA